MFGRHLQEQFNQSPQIVLTMPILLGLDGQKKMSKSLNNYVGLTDSPEDAFGKLMSMPDSNISNYSRLLLLKTESEVARLEEGLSDGSLHPMIEKKRLSFEITNQFWGIEAASQGQLFFEQLFQNQNYDLAKVVKIEVDEVGSIWIGKLLLQAQIVKTSSEAKRLIENNSVFIDGVLVLDFKANISVDGGEILKVGKQVVRLAK
jgi:tyrosyl-tRNA synthetase